MKNMPHMRRLVSLALLAILLGASATVLWMSHGVIGEHLADFWLIDEESWVEKPASRISIQITGPELHRIQPLGKKLRSLLAPFDGQVRQTDQDSPAARVELSATVSPPAVFPIRELAMQVYDQYQDSLMAEYRAARPKAAMRKGRSRKPAKPARAGTDDRALRDVLHRKAILTKSWQEAERAHERITTARRNYRHPDELLKHDPEAQELKQKLVDLEMTLAEVIEQYTPAHPRTKQIQTDITAVRSALDRRAMVAEQEEDVRWERRKAEFQNKKRLLEREEKNARQRAAPRPESAEEPPEAEPEYASVAAPAGLSRRLAMDWSVEEASKKELMMVKRLDSQNAALSVAGVLISAALIGYGLGVFGFSGQSSARPAPAVAPVETPREEPRVVKIPTAAPSKPRSPLPPISAPTVRPPEPEKVIDEKDIPGQAWRSLPELPAVEKGLYTIFAPTSPASELFGKIADHLLSSLPASSGPAVVAVSAVRSGSGASTFTANLGAALAARRPVVLFELHPTAPALHGFFSLKTSSQDVMSAAPWKQTLAATPVDKLSILPMFFPHTEKEIKELKLKKRLPAFLKEIPPDSLVILDIAPIGRSDLFEEVSDAAHVFLLLLGPEPTPAAAHSSLKRLAKAMGKKPVLRVRRTPDALPDALIPRPPAAFEFVEMAT